MIRAFKSFLNRFRRQEDGAVPVVEFVVMFPFIIGLFLMSVELGLYSIRHMFLDRGLDLAVRYVRLNTNTPLTHSELKDMICENAGFIDQCEDTLRLEMVPLDPRNFAQLPQEADCIDLSQPIEPARGFTLGLEHQLMFLRACVKFHPVFPTTGLGYAYDKDNAGMAKMFSSSAFVQEPN